MDEEIVPKVFAARSLLGRFFVPKKENRSLLGP